MSADLLALPGNEIVAVAARDAARAADFAAQFGVARSYGSYAELVADDEVDVVYVATTHGQHYEHALLCIHAGKSLLVEKAFTLNARQAREVVEAARRADVFCMEAMWLRFNPLLRIAAHALHNGAIGDVHSVRAELCRHFPFDPTHRLFDLEVGGGALLDLGVYPINFVWMMLGRPQAVFASGALSPTGSDATAAMQFSYPDGVYAQLSCSTQARSDAVSLIVGTDGWIEAHGSVHRPTRIVIHNSAGEVTHEAQTQGNGYQPELVEVGRCLREGAIQSEIMPLSDTVDILEVIDGVRHELGARYAADDE
ncbi:Predicted dehydrogenase [Frankineae bacterium MT45]|nr:Predicted dehydrogenase [Frankineae bacterium MT45]